VLAKIDPSVRERKTWVLWRSIGALAPDLSGLGGAERCYVPVNRTTSRGNGKLAIRQVPPLFGPLGPAEDVTGDHPVLTAL